MTKSPRTIVTAYPKNKLECLVLLVGGAGFLILVISGYISNSTLGQQEHHLVYDIFSQVFEISLWFFPNSLFPILEPAIGNDLATYSALFLIAYAVFTWIGKYLSLDHSKLRLVKVAVLYILVLFSHIFCPPTSSSSSILCSHHRLFFLDSVWSFAGT